jgi:sporulation protein YlmC with PRC-barrel domain
VSVLMRASEIAKRPVVTFAGEDIAQVKDIVYSAGGGQVGGFTLNGRGLLAGPSKVSLTWASVAALGRDAVMVTDESVLEPRKEMLQQAGASGGGDILGSRVLTDTGVDLGKVVDVIIQVTEGQGTHADVVGYEIDPSEAMNTGSTKVLIPLPDTLAASGEHLMVPAAAKDFVSHDLAGFGAAVEAFRAHLEAGH